MLLQSSKECYRFFSSRLACAIKLEKWMDEMEVSIPINENTENM